MVDLVECFHSHRTLSLVCAGIFLWVSLSMAIRMWLLYPNAGLSKKILWSMVLMVPFLGWMAYLGLFRPPPKRPLASQLPPSAGTYFG